MKVKFIVVQGSACKDKVLIYLLGAGQCHTSFICTTENINMSMLHICSKSHSHPLREREPAPTCHLVNSGHHSPTSVIPYCFSSFVFYLVILLSIIMPIMSASY